MSRFDIRYTEIDDMMWECKDEMDSLIKSCEKYEDYINGFSQLSSFRGEAAEAIKAYMLDVHRSIISSIKTAANEFNDRFLIYKTGYYEIDNSCCYALPEEVLNQAITLYNNKLGDVIYESQRLKNALSNISGIYAIEAPSTFSIENEHNELNDKLNKLIESIKDYESETKTQSLTNLEKLLGALKTSLSKCSAQTSESVTEYTAGSFFTEEHTIDLANNVYVCYTFHSQNERQLEAAWDNEEELRELARQREIQGFWQIVGGAFLIVTGTLCIVCTLGAATPIVVTGMVAGGGTILFGASDMLEGGQNIYYGANGDLSSTAFNPLRDTVFMGNQEIYDNTKNVFAFTAGAMCPISKAYGELGKLSFRTVGTIVGQEIISDQAGNLANMAVTEIGEQWNWNPYFTQTLAMGTGIFASNKTSNTLVGLDQKFNISGNYSKSFSAGMPPENLLLKNNYKDSDKPIPLSNDLIPEHIKDYMDKIRNYGDSLELDIKPTIEDVSLLSRQTGDEFAVITVKDKYYLIRGSERETPINNKIFKSMQEELGTLDYHAHPFKGDVRPSPEDLAFASKIKWQDEFIITSADGKISIYDKSGIKYADTIKNKISKEDIDFYNSIWGDNND